MKGLEFPYEGFKKGLRPFSNNPRNSDYAIELFNLCPAEAGLEEHEQIIDITTANYSWPDRNLWILTESGIPILTESGVYLEVE